MELGQVQVHELMVPRPDMHALPVSATLEDTMRMFATTQRSRLPVYDGSLDHILGFVHIKDVIWILIDRVHSERRHRGPGFSYPQLRPRSVLIVPETKPASELLAEFRARRTGLAMVVDEFGSILGLVTLEDILEQMVGEIHDEFDVVERPLTLPDGGIIFDAGIKVRDLEAQYQIALSDDSSYETIGGFVLSRLGFIPRGGEGFEADGYRFTVMEMDRRRISRVKIKALPPPPAARIARLSQPPPSPMAQPPNRPPNPSRRAKSSFPLALRSEAAAAVLRIQNDPLPRPADSPRAPGACGSSSPWFSCSRTSSPAIRCSRCSAKARAPKTSSKCATG